MLPLIFFLTSLLFSSNIALSLVPESLDGELTVIGQKCNKTAQCAITCGKIIYCEGEYIVNDGVDCPASHPYCVTDFTADYCSNKKSLAKQECQSDFNLGSDFYCTSEGYFPDPKNCSNYIICDENYKATYYKCPSYGYKFNHRNTKECYFWSSSGVPASNCPVINCSVNAGHFARSFPAQPQYYYLCPLSSQVDPILFKCTDGWIFNGRNCVLNCPSIGNYPISGNSTGYYSCLQSGSSGAYSTNNCPSSYVFGPTQQYCIEV